MTYGSHWSAARTLCPIWTPFWGYSIPIHSPFGTPFWTYLDPHLGPCLDPLLGMPFSLYTGDNGYPDGVPNGTPDGTHDQMTSWSNCMSGSSLRNDPKQQHFTSFTC